MPPSISAARPALLRCLLLLPRLLLGRRRRGALRERIPASRPRVRCPPPAARALGWTGRVVLEAGAAVLLLLRQQLPDLHVQVMGGNLPVLVRDAVAALQPSGPTGRRVSWAEQPIFAHASSASACISHRAAVALTVSGTRCRTVPQYGPSCHSTLTRAPGTASARSGLLLGLGDGGKASASACKQCGTGWLSLW